MLFLCSVPTSIAKEMQKWFLPRQERPGAALQISAFKPQALWREHRVSQCRSSDMHCNLLMVYCRIRACWMKSLGQIQAVLQESMYVHCMNLFGRRFFARVVFLRGTQGAVERLTNDASFSCGRCSTDAMTKADHHLWLDDSFAEAASATCRTAWSHCLCHHRRLPKLKLLTDPVHYASRLGLGLSA